VSENECLLNLKTVKVADKFYEPQREFPQLNTVWDVEASYSVVHTMAVTFFFVVEHNIAL
jgi:hypothetical protein